MWVLSQGNIYYPKPHSIWAGVSAQAVFRESSFLLYLMGSYYRGRRPIYPELRACYHKFTIKFCWQWFTVRAIKLSAAKLSLIKYNYSAHVSARTPWPLCENYPILMHVWRLWPPILTWWAGGLKQSNWWYSGARHTCVNTREGEDVLLFVSAIFWIFLFCSKMYCGGISFQSLITFISPLKHRGMSIALRALEWDLLYR